MLDNVIEQDLDLVDKDEICIPHQCLIDYKIIGDTNVSSNIKLILQQYNFNINQDYYSSKENEEQNKLLTIQEQELRKKILLNNVIEQKNIDNRGGNNKIYYILHPDAFKKCLIRAKNSEVFADYYILLEKCIKYYKDYQLEMKQTEMSRMINEMKKSNKKLDESNKKLDKSNKELKEIKIELKELKEENKQQTKELIEIKQKLFTSSHDRVADIESPLKKHIWVLLKNDNKYYSLRVQKDNINRSVQKKINNGFKEVLRIINCPNGMQFNNKLKEVLPDKLKFFRNDITLLEDLTEKELITEIKKIYHERVIIA